LVALKAEPDWVAAAQSLVAALEVQPEPDGRVEVIGAVRAALGDEVYPAYIKLLAAVARFGDAPARKLVADAFAEALATSKLPSVRVPAWGGGLSSRLPPGLGGGALLTHLRAVGPIEFLCLWACRDIANETLDPDSFETALTWLVKLFDSSPRAAVLYQTRLSTDIESPVEGLHDKDSRALVRTLLEAWEGGAAPSEVAAAARRALRPDPFASLGR
jgi:hypothetical protein